MIDMYTVCQRLVIHEGLRLQPYYCSKNKLTIGVGRCIETNPFTAEEEKVIGDWRHGISKCSAMYLLQNDVKKIYKELKLKLKFFKDLDGERQYALIDMAFNLGVFGLLRFSKMLEALKNKEYFLASKECLNSKYAKDVGERANRIANIIATGVYKL